MKFIVRERDREYEFLLMPGSYLIGRDPTCDLTLDSKRVSRHHLVCKVTSDAVTVKDLGSRNGMQVGGVTVKSASLKDSDVLSVGDVEMIFRVEPASQAWTSGAGPSAVPGRGAERAAMIVPQPGGALIQPTVEDEEATPPDGSVVPQSLDQGAHPRLLERDGRWFVLDPASGKEVEIVPALQAGVGARRMSLLGTKKGRLMLGGLAAVVVVLLAIWVVKEPVTRPRGGTGGQVSRGMHDDLLEGALDALDRGDIAAAKGAAAQASAGVPESNREPSKIVGELADVWEPWRKDFFKHWVKVDGALKDLYYSFPSVKAREFVRKHREEIHKELGYSQLSQEARQAADDGDYEGAMQKLQGIPVGSPVRQRDAVLFEEVGDALLAYLTDQRDSAAARQDWDVARGSAQKLADYFPGQKERAEQDIRSYAEHMVNARRISDAKTAMAEARFDDANEQLRGVPEGSPYYGEAVRLLERSKEGAQFEAAFNLYTVGKGSEALDKLATQDTQAARSLARQIELVVGSYDVARQAEQEMRLLEAERSWLDLANAETDGDNYYRKEALRELTHMKERRKEYALQLVAKGNSLLDAESFEGARESYEQAKSMDPDGAAGDDELKQMVEKGRNDYRHGLNMVDNDPQGALVRFTRACRLLTPDDKYYIWAKDKKQDLERRPRGQ